MVSDRVDDTQPLSRDEAHGLIRLLAEKSGLQDLKLDDDGAVWFTDPSGNVNGLIHLTNRPGLLVLAGMPAAAVRSGAALDMMLRANLDTVAAGGGVFGHVPGRDEPFLMAMVPADVSDAARLSEHLDAFFDLAADWRDELNGPEYEPAHAAADHRPAAEPAAGRSV